MFSGRWPRRLLFSLCAIVLIAFTARLYPPLRHPVDSALLLQSLFSGGRGGWLGRWTHPPVHLAATPGGVQVDVYAGRPGSARGCVLLAHGMTDMGRRDPRLIAFARSVARLGFAVAVPDLPGMRRFRPDPQDTARLSKSFLWLSEKFARPGMPCGFFAFSFAAGPAMRTAARPEVAERTGYFIALGAYFDLKTVLRHLTTGGRGSEPAFPGGPPVRVGKWLFLRYNVALLGLQSYEAEIESIIRLKLADEGADVSSISARLPDRLRALLALIENRAPSRFEELFGAQPRAMRALLEEWSMRGVVPKTGMPLFLLHGRSDPFVPAEESERLAALARRRPRGGGSVHLLIAGSLTHVDPGGDGGSAWRRIIGAGRLAGFVSRILTAMEGG